MPRVIEKTVFKFDELSERAKEKAREWYRQASSQDWEPNFDEFEDCAKRLGIEFGTTSVKLMSGKTRYDPDINYSVGDRGEFCVFAGYWTYRPEAVADITADGWTDTTLLDIATELQRAWTLLSLAGGTALTARMTTRSTGCSSMSMSTDVESDLPDDVDLPKPILDTIEKAMEDFANWMLKQMRDDWEYQWSDECVDENIKCNEYEFDENGNLD